MKKTLQMRVIEAEGGVRLDEIIRQRLEDGLTLEEVATDLGITRLTLRDWIERLDLQVVTRKTVVARDGGELAAVE